MNYTIGSVALEQLEERCNKNIVKKMIFNTNIIGYEWIRVTLNTGETYDINLTAPGKFKLNINKLEAFVDTVENTRLCMFIAGILNYKKQKLIN